MFIYSLAWLLFTVQIGNVLRVAFETYHQEFNKLFVTPQNLKKKKAIFESPDLWYKGFCAEVKQTCASCRTSRQRWIVSPLMYLRDQKEDVNRARDWYNKSKKKNRRRGRGRRIKSPSAAKESGDMPSGRSCRRQLCLVWYF